MDYRIKNSNDQRKELCKKLVYIYPELDHISNCFYATDKKRILTKLIFKDGSKKSVQFAKLILEAHLSRRLIGDETVDHIDNDSSNNSISNLQILTRSENAPKGSKVYTEYARANGIVSKSLGKAIPKLAGCNNGKAVLNESQVLEIKQLLEKTKWYRGQDADIAKKFDVARRTISNIRRGTAYI